MNETNSIETWAGRGLGAFFLLAGGVKFLLLPPVVALFEAFGLPQWSVVVVGLIEVASGAALLSRRTRALGAFGVCCVLFGAVTAHLVFSVQQWLLVVCAGLLYVALRLFWHDRPDFLRPDWVHDPHRHDAHGRLSDVPEPSSWQG